MRRPTRTVGIAAACLALTALFCATAFAEDQTPEFKGSIAVAPHSKPPLSLAHVTLLEAAAAAGAQQSGQAVEAELDVENGYLVYGFDFLSASGVQTKAFVDAGTGKLLVTFSEKEDTDSLQVEEGDADKAGENGDHQDKPDLTAADAAKVKVSLADAVKTALSATPGSAVSAKLSTEQDALAYEVTVVGASGKSTSIAVNATTGRVMATEEEDSEDGND
jgi:uncharacterized membrane protein YkoI